MKKSRRQKNEDMRRRYDAIKNLMSTFAMSTVAVVAAVTLIPASPKAEIIKTVALSEEVAYQVNVTDIDSALDPSTLFVVLENQLEYYEQPITLGENAGFFEDLTYNTQYRLSVYGSKGFGQERLDTVLITTREQVGGTILKVTPIEGIHNTTYQVDVSIFDPESKYSSITLYYGYRWEPDEDIVYSSIPISNDREMIELFDIFSSEPFHIYLEGTTADGAVLLDEIWVTPPFELYASAYLAYFNNTEVAFHVYPDSRVGSATFTMNVYLNDRVVKTSSLTPDPESYDHNKLLVSGLKPETTYWFECVVSYTNPQTLRKEEMIVYEGELTTTPNYTYTYDIQKRDTFYEVTISMNDPNDVFDYVYYEAYDTSEEHNMFLQGETYTFTRNGDTKSVTFTIPIPTVSHYEITIGLHSMYNFSVNKIIDVIESQ